MQKLLDILLGVKPASWAEDGSWRLDWLTRPSGDLLLIVIAGIILAAWGTYWLYTREGRGLPRRMKVLLTAMRLAAVGIVLIMLLEPLLVFVKQEWMQSNLIILVDRSESMQLSDPYAVGDAKATRMAQLLSMSDPRELDGRTRLELADRAIGEQLAEKLAAAGDRKVTQLSFTSRVINADGEADAPADFDATATGIGTAIREVLTAFRGQPISGILLVTEGQSNTGEAPDKAAALAADEGVPIVVLAAGTPNGPRNARLVKLDVSPVVFVRDSNQAQVIVESNGMQGQEVTVLLERRTDTGDWEDIGSESVILGDSGQLQTLSFTFAEQQPAKLTMRASITGGGAELTTSDNIALAELRAIRQQIRVLFIAGSSFPEVQFIRNTLLRDKRIDMSSWLQPADSTYEHPGDTPIRRLPLTQDELDRFDCVVMYDPDPSRWPPQFGDMLARFVTQAGGGLVLIAGQRSTDDLFANSDMPGNAWVKLLPVVREPGLFTTEVAMQLSSRSPWRLDITPQGMSDPIFHFADDRQTNERVLSNLPGMYWHFSVTRAKPGATVLAQHGDPRMRNQYGPEVLLATQLVGPGRTFFIGFDSTYRWRYLDEQYFDGFWARVVDRAGRSKQLGGRYPFTLATNRTSYRPGSLVTLTASFLNADDAGPQLDALQGEIDRGSGEPMTITLPAKSGEPGVFEAQFTVDEAGPHIARVWTGGIDGTGNLTPRANTLPFDVAVPNLEYQRPGQDRATLEQLARATGGQVFDMASFDQIPDAFTVKRVANTLEDRQEIWHAPLLWVTALLLIFGEWVLRKRYRMV
jgi:hypothetical protein